MPPESGQACPVPSQAQGSPAQGSFGIETQQAQQESGLAMSQSLVSGSNPLAVSGVRAHSAVHSRRYSTVPRNRSRTITPSGPGQAAVPYCQKSTKTSATADRHLLPPPASSVSLDKGWAPWLRQGRQGVSLET